MSHEVATPRAEAERLRALRRYEILDTPPDGAFDHITALTADLFRVPIALVSLVDHDRIWFKSHHGLEAQQVDREPGLCASAILSPDVYHIRDTLQDIRTIANPLVAGELGLRFYAAAPLRTHDGHNLGTLCIIDRQPRDLSEEEARQLTRLATLVMDQMELRLAAKKVGELEQSQRVMSEQVQQMNRALAESEDRFRDLFDEAPIAYVHEGIDSRFIRANRAAMRTLGIKPEEIQGTYGKTFAPDTPDAQRRLREAFDSIGRGTDTSGVVLELRRKDNGKPVWIQWWSKPDPSGSFTRTMFIDITEHVLMQRDKERLEAQNAYLQEEIRSEHDFTEIIGNSPALNHVLAQVELVAPTDATVLILGETGTGKELLARAIHDRSARKDHPLVKVNCGAISAGLVESELFGHLKGAFTGALTHREGRFKLADSGTIFLDEVGELPLDTQVKLLRVLQEQEFEPLGGSTTMKVSVRVIAATNRDLSEAVRQGKFRSDLYYRLNVVPVWAPPLRERGVDVRLLTNFLLQRFAKKLGRPLKQVSEDTMQRLCTYPWPGNVRELQNVIERAVLLSPGDMLVLPPDFGPASGTPDVEQVRHATVQAAPRPAGETVLTDFERRHIENVLARTNWKIEGEDGAAAALELKPSTLRSRIKKYDIKRPGRPD